MPRKNATKNSKTIKAENLYSSHSLDSPSLLFIAGIAKNLCQVGALALTFYFAAVYLVAPQLQNHTPLQALATTNNTEQTSGHRANSTPYDSNWVFRQSEEKYTIQYASSPDKELIYEHARSFANTDDVTVFPFKKNRDKHFVYGVTAGLYDSVKSAKQAISKLPQSVRESEPWIRSIGELQIQVARTLDT